MDRKETNCLISGSRGLLGSAFVDYCKDHKIRYQTLLPFPCSMTDLKEKLSGGEITHFINCAGYSNDVTSKDVPYEVYQSNFICVLNQLESIRKFSPQTKYLNFGSIYEITKDSIYAKSKRASSELIYSYRLNYNIQVKQSRLSFTEYTARGENRFLPKLIKRLINGETVTLTNDRDYFNFCWATDVCEGAFNVMEDQECLVGHELINPDSYQLGAIVTIILNKLNLPEDRVIFNNGLNNGTNRISGQYLNLRFKPKVTILDIVEKLINFELSNKTEDQSREIYGKPT